jgi:hypothetical protein
MTDTPKAASPAQSRRITLAIRRGAKPEQIHRTLDQIFKLSGCLACGLLGFDLHFYGVDPAVEHQLELPEGGPISAF